MADVIQAQDTKATNLEIAAVLSHGAKTAPGFSVDTTFVQNVAQEFDRKGGKTALETLAEADKMIQRRKYQGEHFTPQTEAKKYSSEADPGLEGRVEQRMSEISLVQVGLELIASGKDLKATDTLNQIESILLKYGLDNTAVKNMGLNNAGDVIKKAMLILVNEPLLKTYLAGLSSLTKVDDQVEWLVYICRKLPTFSDNLAKAIGEWKDKYQQLPTNPEDPQKTRARLVSEVIGDENNPLGRNSKLEQFIAKNKTTKKPVDNDKLKFIFKCLKSKDPTIQKRGTDYLKSEFGIDTATLNFVSLDVFNEIKAAAQEITRLEGVRLTAEEQAAKNKYENTVRLAETDLSTVIAQAFVETYRDVEVEMTRAKTEYNRKKAEEAAKEGKRYEAEYYNQRMKRWIEEPDTGLPKIVHLDNIRSDLMIIKQYGEAGAKYLVLREAGLIPPERIGIKTATGGYIIFDFRYPSGGPLPNEVQDYCQKKYGCKAEDIIKAHQTGKLAYLDLPFAKTFLDTHQNLVSEHVTELINAYQTADKYLKMGPLTTRWYFGGKPPTFDGDKRAFRLTPDEIREIGKNFEGQWRQVLEKDQNLQGFIRDLENKGIIRGTPDFNKLLMLILMLLGGAGGALGLFGLLSGVGGAALFGSVGAIGGEIGRKTAQKAGLQL